MENQKLENLLNLALNATPEELEKSENLSVGYETEQGKWEVIVKYSGEPEIFENPEIQTVRLLGGFAILTLSQNQIERLANDAGVEFIEKINIELPESDLNHNILVFKKVKNTPDKYPRKAGKPAKSPIK